jgi:hypothetical protein
MDNFIPAIPALLPSLGSSVDDAHRAAVAITTTGVIGRGQWRCGVEVEDEGRGRGARTRGELINCHSEWAVTHTCAARCKCSHFLDVPHPCRPPDLVSKEAALQVTIGGRPVSVGGMCKGSGMIHPNMATMLGVVTTDADVDVEVWRGMLRRATDASFNAVRVQGGRGLGLGPSPVVQWARWRQDLKGRGLRLPGASNSFRDDLAPSIAASAAPTDHR